MAQIALAAFMWRPQQAATVEPRPLIDGGGNALTHLEIVASGDEAVPVVLDAKDGVWTLTSNHGYPADPEKVGEVVSALAGITLRTPIATQAVSHEALKVTDTTFEKKVSFTAGDVSQTLLVGAAASKAIHLRKEGSDEVYKAKGLSAWSLKDTARGYLPSNHSKVEVADLGSVRIRNDHGDITFAKVDGAWTVEGDATRIPVQSKLDSLLEKIGTVRLDDVVGDQVEAAQGLTTPQVRVEWAVTEGDQAVPGGFVIGAESDGKYFLKTDDSPFVILSPGYRLKELLEADPAELTKIAEPPPAPPEP